MNNRNTTRILAIGPLPPPLAGTSVSFELFCKFVRNRKGNLHLEVINSAPRSVGEKPLVSTDNLVTALRILSRYLVKIWQADLVIVFGSDKFLLSLMPLCLGTARLLGKPCFVRAFGGSLDAFFLGLSPRKQRYFRWALSSADGLLVQTATLKAFFTGLFGAKVHHVPGYRLIQTHNEVDQSLQRVPDVLRLVYVGHIREEKGVFDLLDSLKILQHGAQCSVECDFFGPLYSDVVERFKHEIEHTSNAYYKGILEPTEVVSTIADYDVFVFPSFYKGEGHPGVLIEAMVAGAPIISTDFKSIPELIEHGVNGLLVSPNQPEDLARAIRELRDNTELRVSLSENSYRSRLKYSSAEVIPQILEPMGILV